MGQEKMRQQHVKELEEKELDVDNIKASTQKRVRFITRVLFKMLSLSKRGCQRNEDKPYSCWPC